MNRPLILLDVDGPLNPYAAKPTRRPEGYQTFRWRLPSRYEAGVPIYRQKPLRVWLTPWHGPALLKLAEETGSDLAWATTWEKLANEYIGPAIGLPELPVVEFGFKAKQWKFNAVLEYAENRPFIWFDDDFRSFDVELKWFLNLRGEDPPHRLHFVDPRIGLTELDFAQADRWLRSLSSD